MNEFWEVREKMDYQQIDDRLDDLGARLALLEYRMEQAAKTRRWLVIGLAVVSIALISGLSPVELIKGLVI